MNTVTLSTLTPNAACVYCGSSPGTSPEFMQLAEAVGRALAQANIGLVYGGGRRGLMGGVAFSCAQAGGNVLGVVPQAIQASGGEGTGPVLSSRNEEDEAVWARTKTIVVQSMHERKLAVIVLNALGYYEPLKQLIREGVKAGFIKPANASLVSIVDPPENGDWGQAVVTALQAWEPHAEAGYKWNWNEAQIPNVP